MTNQLNIGSIFGATITTDDIERTAQPYIVDLNYKLHSFHKISKELATTMNAIAHLGAKCLILRPESKPYPWIRFIESKKFKNIYVSSGKKTKNKGTAFTLNVIR